MGLVKGLKTLYVDTNHKAISADKMIYYLKKYVHIYQVFVLLPLMLDFKNLQTKKKKLYYGNEGISFKKLKVKYHSTFF